MSEAQREQLTAILDDLYEGFTDDVAASKGKSAAEVSRLLVCTHACGVLCHDLQPASILIRSVALPSPSASRTMHTLPSGS